MPVSGISAKPLVYLRVPNADSDGTAPGKGTETGQEGWGDTSCPMPDPCLPYVKGQAVFVKYTGHEK